MAALLDLVHLRRHAMPEHFLVGIALQTDRAPARAVPPRAAIRPLLAATWLVGADGRPACAWLAEAADPDIPLG